MNKSALKRVVPGPVWRLAREAAYRTMVFLANRLQYNFARRTDFSNPLPYVPALRATRSHWDRPSELVGVRHDTNAMKARFAALVDRFGGELDALPPYDTMRARAGGWGCPRMDVLTLYMMIRDLKPRRYLEVGSGLTTAYVRLAGERNAAEGHPLAITCIEPYPSEALKAAPDVCLEPREVQDLDASFFSALDDGDMLFLDSSHVLKIGSDVAYLYLEVVPRLRNGVWVHVHDVPFPWNTPHPADFWVLSDTQPPFFWTEAMIVQAFLAFNDAFQVELSTPMIRHHDEAFLRQRVPGYQGIAEQPNTFSSLYFRRVRGA